MVSPDKKSKARKRSPKSDKSADVDFVASDGESSSTEGSDYAAGGNPNQDLMDIDLPVLLPNPPSGSTPRGNSLQHASSNSVTRVSGPSVVSVSEAVASRPYQPAFMIPPQPYAPFPLKFPNNEPPNASLKKRPSDSIESNNNSQAINGNTETRPHKKVRKEQKSTSGQPHLIPLENSIRDRSKQTKESSLPLENISRMSKSVSTPAAHCSVCTQGHEDGACLIEEEKQMLEYRNLILSEDGDETPEQQVRNSGT